MHAEFGFTLNDLREVCGGLLDLATADKVIRIDRAVAIANIASNRGMPSELVSAVLDMVTLSRRSSFLAIKQDSLPWRFNRDMSYVRRPVVLQGGELVFGFRSLYNLVPFWVDSLLSGRLQAQAKTIEMKQCISEARTQINDAFAHDVSTQLSALGISTMISVKKIGKRRIVDALGQDLGDIDILGAHTASKTIIAVEAKDFEVARTPSELTHEVQKLFAGTAKKKATVELHSRRLDWLREHLGEVIAEFGIEDDAARWRVNGLVITSEPLVSPLVQSSLLPVFPVDDLDSHTLNLGNTRMASRKTKQRSN